MTTQQTPQPHQILEQSRKDVTGQIDLPATNPVAPVFTPATDSSPQLSSNQPAKQTGHAIFYLLGQAALLGMALYSAKNFQVALGWVVLSLAFTQVMADSVHFTRPNLKKWVVGACTIIPGLIALVSSYIG